MNNGKWLLALLVLASLVGAGCAEKKETLQVPPRAPGGVQHGNRTIPEGAMPPPGYKFGGQKP